ncbi:MAG: protein phosphatase 2C domain-containing protein, partial [Phycisphaerae bacterium]|nr:protein phosphatase 2C domain-containing protein [Phycisphaerae bacterium]
MRKILSYGKSDIGLYRENNEDTFWVDPVAGFCLVADGMGGGVAGELASRFFSESAIEVFQDYKNPSKRKAKENIQKTFRLANEKILNHVARNSLHERMGCTAELIVFFDEGFVLGHIGDSRTYRVREGLLK